MPRCFSGSKSLNRGDDEAGGLHQPVKIGQISRIVGRKADWRCPEPYARPWSAPAWKERRQELHLAQRLAAADRCRPFAPVVAVARHNGWKSLSTVHSSPPLAGVSGLWQICTAGRTCKDDEADAGAVHRTESSATSGRIRVGYRAAWHGDDASICCSRVSR